MFFRLYQLVLPIKKADTLIQSHGLRPLSPRLLSPPIFSPSPVLVSAPCITSSSPHIASYLTRISPLQSQWSELDRKSKNKKRREEDYDQDDHDQNWNDQPISSKKSNPSKKTTKNNSSSPPAPIEAFDIKPTYTLMGDVLKILEKELSNIKVGRADPQLIQSVIIGDEPLSRLGQIQVRDSQTLSISLYDISLISKVSKAISASNINLNPTNDNRTILIPVPKPTLEYRQSLIKSVYMMIEKAKVEIRNIRRDVMANLKKISLPKDEVKALERLVQSAHDEFIKKIDTASKKKEQDLAK